MLMKLDCLSKLVLLGVSVMMAGPALSQENANPCLPDVEKLCKGVPAAGGRVMKCLNDNEAKLSSDCRKTLGLVTLEWQACRADAEKLCRNEAAAKTGVSKCLKANESKVTAACKSAMNDVQDRIEKNHPCVRDAQKFCKDVKPGEGRIMNCLKSHQGELAPACRAAVLDKPDEKKNEKKK
jgi:hypothetical protein